MKRMQTAAVRRTLRAGAIGHSGVSMKPALLLLSFSLVTAASGAFAQGNSDACHNQYGSCMERCSSRPQALQEKCSQSCEASTNQCYAGVYGPSSSQTLQPGPDASSAQEAQANDARDEARDLKLNQDAKLKKKR
jgi:hypothetical protein